VVLTAVLTHRNVPLPDAELMPCGADDSGDRVKIALDSPVAECSADMRSRLRW
jgi:hypothetical protein